jgi:class 3 adenylate cyclase
LALLAVLLAVVLGLLLGARVRRHDKVEERVALAHQPEEHGEPPALSFADLRDLLVAHSDEALSELAEAGLLQPAASDGRARWHQELLTAYVGEEVVERIASAAAEGEAAGGVEIAQNAEGTILFFDLRGFSNATEHLGGAYVMRLLNVYLRQMGEVVAVHRGTVDKFIGDNVMATFGILRELSDPAQSATDCACSMIERMVEINHQLSERGLPSLRPSVGIASGLVVAGTLGGVKRRSFTVIGAAVNRAARLEHATRELGVDLLMDHVSYEQLVQPLWGMKVHHGVQLRGIDQPTLAWSWTRPKVSAQEG